MERPKTAQDIRGLKGVRRQTWITAYDYVQAQLAELAEIDVILVGDSLGMTTLGYPTTLPVTVRDMMHHARIVRRGAPNTPMIVDMPFLSYTDPNQALRNAGRFIQGCGAEGVKLEGGRRILPQVEALVAEGIPVVGHLGLTPQSVHRFGGYRVQARAAEAIRELVEDAESLAEAGVIAIVLEGIPDRVAEYVTRRVPVPTIGIGAGNQTDGQVLVFHDCVGLSARLPKFAKPFADVRTVMVTGLAQYREAVLTQSFPDEAHAYHLADEEWERFLQMMQRP
ncbi:MAG: 3-methyl-2-oxobutanoate hydroxymethyltransferase [Firmicutes bacterium]|nr:3-methyl-2-oxobutanoate hydroxymethyltransferase [Alicyclobacillaceae bacterium]MCL6498363.1 3-methyl-2-oxobutanoate hydroxymethyltransferase [Bacillota bacterium]